MPPNVLNRPMSTQRVGRKKKRAKYHKPARVVDPTALVQSEEVNVLVHRHLEAKIQNLTRITKALMVKLLDRESLYTLMELHPDFLQVGDLGEPDTQLQ